MALRTSIMQKQQQRLSPAQMQLMSMLTLPVVAFTEKVEEELADNPALEKIENSETQEPENDYTQENTEINLADYGLDDETPAYRLRTDQSYEEERRESRSAAGISRYDFLMEQLGTSGIHGKEYEMAKFIIGSIEPDGYLRRSSQAIADDMAFSLGIDVGEEGVEQTIKKIQLFEPSGIAARNLQECLRLQLEHKQNREEYSAALRIINRFFDLLILKNYKRLLELTGFNKKELHDAITQIEQLSPRPLSGFETGYGQINYEITPDFIISIEDGIMNLSLNSANTPQLRLSSEYQDLLRDLASGDAKQSKSREEAAMFVKQKVDSARWFVDAVRQRQATLMKTMREIVKRQGEFLLSADVSKLTPLKLKDIADAVSMDISTVSRVVSSKYVDTPFGIFSLKDFFSEASVNESGEEISTREIKAALSGLIENEDKQNPLVDEELLRLLTEKGYKLSRRTVAKYRARLGYDVARLRKKL